MSRLRLQPLWLKEMIVEFLLASLSGFAGLIALEILERVKRRETSADEPEQPITRPTPASSWRVSGAARNKRAA